MSSLERERNKLYARVEKTPHKKKIKQRPGKGPIISMPFASDEHGRHLGILRDPEDRGKFKE